MRVPRRRLASLVRFVARREGVKLGLVDLAIVGRPQIAAVNRRHLGHAGATDVISFDLSDQHTPGLCVQLVVCGDVARRQGPPHGLRPLHELMLYVIHGLLHQMGHDDTTARSAARMSARQEELLREFLKGERPRKLIV